MIFPNGLLSKGNSPYYFFSDHLGSSSYIVNAAGNVSQHMEYLSFGETLAEEHLNSINSPFKYNGKAFDGETGNYYYGARYYDPKLSIWLSVDPLAEKYVGWSPYNYTLNNPIRFIDPDGRSVDDPIYGQNFWGALKLIGDDGKNDGKIHIVYNKEQQKTIEKQTEGGNKAIDLSKIDKVTINGGKHTINGIVASTDAQAKETSPGAGDGGLHEEGGDTRIINGDITVTPWVPGPKKTADKGGEIPPFNNVGYPEVNELLDYWHVHTSGMFNVGEDFLSGEKLLRGAAPGPSPRDYTEQTYMINKGYSPTAIQVDTRGGNIVNFYNGGNVVFKLPLYQLKQLVK
ncbi:RHS repeat-associated core domain-containing protein [Flavobacterium sp. MAH-1]|uniref:RHS repeat-associated core domain-containing protein n=2 Tax=Flavobacterium agri TaxID=2743471 RepID=A0A7Y8Y3P1_9FLAO|nr:RHS repeat-associated core domain-containing protein [Flavobacterium agri]NYA71937.1 RHS repeat-associated core domain-containing protein [Flavobacterium agri]